MTTAFLAADIARDEGLVLKAYPDPLSPRAGELVKPLAKRVRGWETLSGRPWTIGHGHTGNDVYEGLVWTKAQAVVALRADIEEAMALLDRVLPWWRSLNDARQDVLANMMFNMGWDNPKTPALEGLATFTVTLPLIKSGIYGQAADNMLQSKWAAQTKDRAKRLAQQMRSGVRA